MAEVGSENSGTGAAVTTIVKMVGFDKPFFTALAIALTVGALIYAGVAEREARLSQYYAIDLEVYMLKQGLKPPPDPWRENHGDKK